MSGRCAIYGGTPPCPEAGPSCRVDCGGDNLVPGVDYDVSVCPNCGNDEHTTRQWKVCYNSIVPQKRSCINCEDPHFGTTFGDERDRFYCSTRCWDQHLGGTGQGRR